MVEALVLFESVVNSVWFTRSSVILFLNKADVLAQKIQDPRQQVNTTLLAVIVMPASRVRSSGR